MKNKAVLLSFLGGAATSLIIGALVAYGVISSGIIDPGADQPIPSAERWAAKTSIRAYLKGHTPTTTNPLPLSDENLMAGCKLYINNCAVCHGLADNKHTRISQGFYKNAPLFAKEDWSKDADGLVYWFIEHGVRLTAMPAYSKSLNENEKWQLVMFIKATTRLPRPVSTYWNSIKSLDVAK